MNVAFIPVRGGSKSIPFKNIKLICGKPLVYWTAKAACECQYIDKVYVSTESEAIRNAVEMFICELPSGNKIEIIDRSPDTATDNASTESAMLEFAEKYMFDNIILVQATSPMLTARDLNGGFELYETDNTDSVLSTVRQYRFLWKRDKDEYVMPVNYDVFHRPRRQEFEGYLLENGAFYICSREKLLKTGNRLSGNIKAYEMGTDTAFEIDEPSDWLIIEALMKKNRLSQSGRNIKMFLTDCDGCLTDGGMYYSERGDELKKFNTKDGMGLKNIRSKGIVTGIITGENTQIVEDRANKLCIDEVHQGITDKLSVVKQLVEKYQISLAEVVYVGDDVNDISVMEQVGFPCTVNNANSKVKELAIYVSPYNGGDGAIRDIIDHVLGEINY